MLTVPKMVLNYALVCFPILVAGTIASLSPWQAIEKLDGVLFGTSFLAILYLMILNRIGEERVRGLFLSVCVLVLFCTLVYKAKFGFFDRNVRFFLNGPIVYGWIMALAAVAAFAHWFEFRKRYYLLLFAIFTAALVWTESKGPLLAFFGSLLFFGLSAAKRSPKTILAIVALGAALSYLLYPLLLSRVEGTRLEAIARIFEWSFSDNDQGSVGDRVELYRYAMSLILENPTIGIGIGNFRYGQYIYPHNIHLEIFVELGVLVGLAHLIFVSASFFRSPLLYRSLIVLFVLCGCFSGDMSYLRFLYCFCLVGIYLGRASRCREHAIAANS